MLKQDTIKAMKTVDISNKPDKLNKLILSLSGYRREIVVACFGTDSVLGDCLGPVAGQMLVGMNVAAFVYGTLLNPITALNADEYSRFIRERHPSAIIIAVDSSVGLKEDVGKIRINKGKLYPAAALNKKRIGLGDISVTAVVSDCPPQSAAFSSVRLSFIYSLSTVLASLIFRGVNTFNCEIEARNCQALTPALSVRC